MVTGASLSVTDTTTAKQLNDFAQQLDDGKNLKAKRNQDGSYTLWASSSKASLWARITGKAKARREAALAVIDRVIRQDPSISETVRGDIKALLKSDITRPVLTKPGTEVLKVIANYAAKAEQGDFKEGQTDGCPSLRELPFAARVDIREATRAIASDLNAGNADDTQLRPHVQSMAASLVTAFTSKPLAEYYPTAILSDPEELVSELAGRILEGIADPTVRSESAEKAHALAREAFNEASYLQLGGRMVPGSDAVEIDGKIYQRREQLGSGAFGQAFRYEASDGSGSVAIKFPNNDDKQTFESFRQEIPSHMRAARSGHENVLGFRGALRTVDGQLAIASELAPLGTALDAHEKIQRLVEDGNISPEAALAVQLTMIRDMLSGVGDLHDSAGMTHIDFKTPNVFIAEDGVCKVADFGESVEGDNPLLTSAHKVDNPTWKGATVLYEQRQGGLAQVRKSGAQAAQDAFIRTFFPEAVTENGPSMEAMKDAYGVKAFRFVDTMSSRLGASVGKEYAASTSFDGIAYDMYALGVSAVNVLLGDLALPQQGVETQVKIEQQIVSFVEAGVLAIGDHEGALRSSTGDADIDDLINALTHPDASQRPHDFDALLAMPALQKPHVGAPESRALLAAIMRSDAYGLSEALAKFD